MSIRPRSLDLPKVEVNPETLPVGTRALATTVQEHIAEIIVETWSPGGCVKIKDVRQGSLAPGLWYWPENLHVVEILQVPQTPLQTLDIQIFPTTPSIVSPGTDFDPNIYPNTCEAHGPTG